MFHAVVLTYCTRKEDSAKQPLSEKSLTEKACHGIIKNRKRRNQLSAEEVGSFLLLHRDGRLESDKLIVIAHVEKLAKLR